MIFRFLSRLAFICNLFFVFAVIVQLIPDMKTNQVTATIGIMGYFLAVLLNPLVNLVALALWMFKRKYLVQVPRWLLLANFIFLLLQIVYLIFLNDTRHH
jgi:hypothetical protein